MKIKKTPVKHRGEYCLNCGVPLYKTDRYCHYCGQVNSVKKLSLKSVFKEFFAGLFAYDSRIYKTLKTLVFNPGKLAFAYVNGKRKSYVNPFRFFFSIAVIVFILQGLGINETEQTNENFINITPPKKDTEQDYSVKNFKNLPIYKSEKEINSLSFTTALKSRLVLYSTFYEYHADLSIKESLEVLGHQVNKWNVYLFKRSKKFYELMQGSQAFQSYLYSKLPLFAFITVPLLSLSLWLLFFKSNYNFIEHLIFNYYLQGFNLLLFTFFDLLTGLINANFPWFIFLLIYCWYFYKSLRNFYQQKTLKTIVKTVLLNLIFYILAAISILISVLGTFVIY